MLRRGYCQKLKSEYHTYKDVSVCSEWLLFSNFKAWMELQDFDGKELDKDIIKPGNKVYSPEACCFVPARINTLLNYQCKNRGKYPLGVHMHKKSGKLAAAVRLNGKNIHIGLFSNEIDASIAYARKKYSILMSEANEINNPLIKKGLIIHANKILDNALSGGL